MIDIELKIGDTPFSSMFQVFFKTQKDTDMTHVISERISDEMAEGWFNDIEMIYEDTNGPCYLKVVKVCPEHDIEIKQLDDEFPNHVKLSAFLASELTTYGARKFLYRHGVPKESLLWSLNHAGWADMSNE